jgi:hypothetical protein
MIQSVEAVIDAEGNVHLLESIRLSGSKRAIVTILEETPLVSVAETALLSEVSLAEDWLKTEEDEANRGLISRKIGDLKQDKFRQIIKAVVDLLMNDTQNTEKPK